MSVRVINADVLEGLRQLDDESVHCVVTSPPYWGLRDYGVDGQIGLERTPQEFIARLVEVFREVRRVLRKDGTCWVNLGDSYANDGKWGGSSGGKHVEALHGDSGIGRGKRDTGLKPKDLVGIPWRFAFAMQDDGWWLRQDIIWHKPNPMPESVTDRCTKAHEYLFLLTKAERYFYDAEAIKEPAAWPDGPNSPQSIASPYGQGFTRKAGVTVADGRKALRSDVEERHRASIPGGQSLQAEPDGKRNKRSVWTIATVPFSEAHFATFPPELPELCIKAGTSAKGCCAKCGAPWERISGREQEMPHVDGSAVDRYGTGDHGTHRKIGSAYQKALAANPVVTKGWSPSCSCDTDVVPCVVLDPFGGAGTTGLVADRLQRNAILIELNPEYAAMAERRVNRDRGGLLDLMEAAQ